MWVKGDVFMQISHIGRNICNDIQDFMNFYPHLFQLYPRMLNNWIQEDAPGSNIVNLPWVFEALVYGLLSLSN